MDSFLDPVLRHRVCLRDMSDRLNTLMAQKVDLERAIDDYNSFSPEIVGKGVALLDEACDELSKKIAIYKENKLTCENYYRKLLGKEAHFLMIWEYFSDEQVAIRSKIDVFRRGISSASQSIREAEVELNKKHNDIQVAKKKLSHYAAFDPHQAACDVDEIQSRVDSISSEKAIISEELTRMEKLIEPFVKEHNLLKDEASSTEVDISKAKKFERDLDRAGEKYERAMIHKECECCFGDGRPRDINRRLSLKLRSLKKNMHKIERRIEEELRKFNMKIDHLFIDGNNICYDRENFIGFQALSALLGELRGRFNLTVVFDASIRKLMRTDTQGIEKLLGKDAAVHITPTGTYADDYLMRLTEESERVFILSNDRYAEYHDYSAVKSGRLLRFMIVDRSLIVSDLDITLQF